ncbi:polysaccharide biosynthesis protein GumN [Zhengella mangrovi]|uniref:Polysaccharide biosynthesis protein GumN n=1 Tax=Zhengella mangrovi TaxID=1982044 RepID=A0A2G1QV98_9HYPH|nr:TraB/GumN family protein [Zhengella mangrovi]PHP69128.1 polysaccharide biosynthesis protein GumN [Zhengella mangrovi]
MRHVDHIADSLCLNGARLLAALHGLLFLAFLATLLLLAPQVRADDQVSCTGQNLLQELAAEDPARLVDVEEKAAAVVNGEGLLWKIEKPGVVPSYLFGTMHLTDPRVVTLTPPARKAFDAAGTVVVEAVDALDPKAAAAAVMQRPDLMMFTDGRKLTDLLDPEDRALVEKELATRGMPLVAVERMKPWVVSSALALPACEMARKKSGAPFLDARLAEDARAQGKALKGLETMISQMEAMDSMPLKVHLDGLISTLALGDRIDDMIETMIVLYQKGQTGMVWPMLEAMTPEQSAADESYATFEKVMVTARNHGMVASAEPIIDAGNAFIAVGALHLPGKEGVIELLRKAGYTVTRAD